MREVIETSDVPADTVRSRTKAQRSGTADSGGHRRSADAVAGRVRQGSEGTPSPVVAETAERIADLLEDGAFAAVSVPGKNARGADRFDDDSENVQGGRAESGAVEKRHSAHSSTFLRDRVARSGSRPVDDQSPAGSQEFLDHDDLSAREAGSPGIDAQSDRLAASQSTSWLAASTEQQQQQLNVAGLLRRYTPGYVVQYQQQAPPQVQSTLAKLSLCRTSALGGRKYRCISCEHETILYNSCGDRHCPQCAGAKRSDWLQSTLELLLPGVNYFQVVFTIPKLLSSLALGNRKAMYDLLFRSSWRALREIIAEEQGFEAAAGMVLHTWNQLLEQHAHTHAFVPGGGPSLTDPGRWITSRRPGVPRQDGPYLVDADALRHRFRELFLAGLRRLHACRKTEARRRLQAVSR